MATNLQRIGQLLKMPIVWHKLRGEPGWTSKVEGEECILVMNDFPEEPLYTLKWRDNRLDLDDAPNCWQIPYE